MKILFAWTGVTSYMADCWRTLQRQTGVELKIVVERVDSGKEFDADRVLHGLDYALVEPRTHLDLKGFSPDVIFAGGWRSANTRQIVEAFPKVAKVFCLDMPWRSSLRCVLARFVLWRFMRRFDRVYVPGAWSARYARWLGFRPERIERKLYAVDFAKLRRRDEGVQRTGFLYLGRFAPEKGLDVLIRAYRRYRELGGTWSFDLYGAGPLEPWLRQTIGQSDRQTVFVRSFAQPDEIPGIYRAHACLLMASAFDPWPLVILESRAAGLEVIASDRCGNGAELGVRQVPFGDGEAMAREMLKMESVRCRPSAATAVALTEYDCRAWATRTLEIAKRTVRICGWCPGVDEPANGMAVVARLVACDTAWSGVCVVHGMWLPRGWWECLRHFSRYVRMPHGSLSPLYLESRSKWMKRLVGPVERFFLRRAEKVLATCVAEKEWIMAYEPKAKVEVIDLKRFFRLEGVGTAKAPCERETVNLLYLGRRHPLKGVRYLEQAVESCDPRFHLKLVSDAVGEEKDRAWNWCDVLVLPSLSENFGLVVAEALERNKRVIVTDGAPAWADWHDRRLVYLRGYRDGDGETRVRLLKQALIAR